VYECSARTQNPFAFNISAIGFSGFGHRSTIVQFINGLSVDKYSHEGCYPLIGRQGALCGNVQYVVGKFYATEHAVVATPKINIDTLWLSFALRNQNLNKLATGAAQPGLTVGKLNDVKIGLPPINRQKRFADFVCHVDKSKFELQQRLEKLEILYKSLTQKCFIGEIYE